MSFTVSQSTRVVHQSGEVFAHKAPSRSQTATSVQIALVTMVVAQLFMVHRPFSHPHPRQHGRWRGVWWRRNLIRF